MLNLHMFVKWFFKKFGTFIVSQKSRGTFAADDYGWGWGYKRHIQRGLRTQRVFAVRVRVLLNVLSQPSGFFLNTWQPATRFSEGTCVSWLACVAASMHFSKKTRRRVLINSFKVCLYKKGERLSTMNETGETKRVIWGAFKEIMYVGLG